MQEPKLKPEMILLARTSRQMSQKELAAELGVAQSFVWKLESEERTLSEEKLERLSKVLSYPPDFFFESWNIFRSISPNYRKRASLSPRLKDAIEARSNIQRMHIYKLLRAYEIKTNVKYLDLDDLEGPEHAALATRQYWKVPSGPIKNLSNILEQNGILIFKCDFGTDLLDGFTIKDNINPPLIFINKHLTGDRQRFTLCHEAAHIIVHSFYSPEMEKEADTFAAEFLMPATDIYTDLQSLSLHKLAILKKKWNVSMGALLYRAKTLGAVSENQYFYMIKQMSSLGYRKREPPELDIPFEEPQLIRRLIEVHLNEMGVEKSKLAQVLRIDPAEFENIYGLFSKSDFGLIDKNKKLGIG